MSEPVWIFGYGSLVWRPAFEFNERRVGLIRGWTRRFWQQSTDHRGVPEAPGRVVTLHRQPRAICHGMVYSVAPHVRSEVLAKLDHREKNGYQRHHVEVETHAGERLSALVYVAGPDNEHYVGPRDLDEIAAVVKTAVGPSGPNLEYVLELAAALRDMGAQDDHVFALESLVRGS
jgi:cation transport regulator ChaC